MGIKISLILSILVGWFPDPERAILMVSYNPHPLTITLSLTAPPPRVTITNRLLPPPPNPSPILILRSSDQNTTEQELIELVNEGDTIIGFTLSVLNDFNRFLSQFSTNCHNILQAPFSIHVLTTLNTCQMV